MSITIHRSVAGSVSNVILYSGSKKAMTVIGVTEGWTVMGWVISPESLQWEKFHLTSGLGSRFEASTPMVCTSPTVQLKCAGA